MSDKRQLINSGEIIIFSNGAYSDFGYVGECVAIKDFCLRQDALRLYKQFVFKTVDPKKDHYFGDELDAHAFVTWMIANGYLLPLDAREIHLGDYCDILGENAADWYDQMKQMKKGKN